MNNKQQFKKYLSSLNISKKFINVYNHCNVSNDVNQDKLKNLTSEEFLIELMIETLDMIDFLEIDAEASWLDWDNFNNLEKLKFTNENYHDFVSNEYAESMAIRNGHQKKRQIKMYKDFYLFSIKNFNKFLIVLN